MHTSACSARGVRQAAASGRSAALVAIAAAFPAQRSAARAYFLALPYHTLTPARRARCAPARRARRRPPRAPRRCGGRRPGAPAARAPRRPARARARPRPRARAPAPPSPRPARRARRVGALRACLVPPALTHSPWHVPTRMQAHTRAQRARPCAQLMLTQRPSHAAQSAADAIFSQCVRGACPSQRRCAARGPCLNIHRHDLRGGRAGPVQSDLELHAAGALCAGRDKLQPVRRGMVLLRGARRTLRAAAHRSPSRHDSVRKHSLRCGTATGRVASLASRFRQGARSARAAGLGPGWVSARPAPAGRPPGRPGGARRRARPPLRAGRRPHAGRPRWPAGPPASACARPRASWSTTVSPLHLHR